MNTIFAHVTPSLSAYWNLLVLAAFALGFLTHKLLSAPAPEKERTRR